MGFHDIYFFYLSADFPENVNFMFRIKYCYTYYMMSSYIYIYFNIASFLWYTVASIFSARECNPVVIRIVCRCDLNRKTNL